MSSHNKTIPRIQPGGIEGNQLTKVILVFDPGILNSIHFASGLKGLSLAISKPKTLW